MKTAHTFNELSKEAKANAILEYRDSFIWDYEEDEACSDELLASVLSVRGWLFDLEGSILEVGE
jgi:hypothetical protein